MSEQGPEFGKNRPESGPESPEVAPDGSVCIMFLMRKKYPFISTKQVMGEIHSLVSRLDGVGLVDLRSAGNRIDVFLLVQGTVEGITNLAHELMILGRTDTVLRSELGNPYTPESTPIDSA